ncbi:hypothetical protein [Roseospira visakhapatnamensis]|uniref:Uncharacterized protein n=1 Tax=Roseospira visakhapatnamensis TaxID=390880 RepID=A0A7W6RC02_9PROT|nr:hypothetical protein [Roseospira visakhapatnamensis]MBB4265351.1 hypothetical protein [Roseospira visakhapatnamensis]
MTAMEQYRTQGLRQPIRFFPGAKFHWALWGGGSFLLLGCALMLNEGTALEQLIGLFGLLFFGTCCAILIVALARSGRRGVFEISDQGLYMAHLGLVLPWEDIGPVWINTVPLKVWSAKDLLFVLRNASHHQARADGLGRLLLRMAVASSRSRKRGVLEWGLRAGLVATDAGMGLHRSLTTTLETMRAAVLSEPDALVFNVPITLRFGTDTDDLLAIINQEIVARRTPGPRQDQDPDLTPNSNPDSNPDPDPNPDQAPAWPARVVMPPG